jgi:U3 small nucleolar RNA-associated protein MPP10
MAKSSCSLLRLSLTHSNSIQVCRQLDGLSHFHFTPKPVVLESRVFGSGPENALPSLSLEDIIPSTESSSALLAPEEVRDC